MKYALYNLIKSHCSNLLMCFRLIPYKCCVIVNCYISFMKTTLWHEWKTINSRFFYCFVLMVFCLILNQCSHQFDFFSCASAQRSKCSSWVTILNKARKFSHNIFLRVRIWSLDIVDRKNNFLIILKRFFNFKRLLIQICKLESKFSEFDNNITFVKILSFHFLKRLDMIG